MSTQIDRGLQYEDFRIGDTLVHHWGRTLTDHDSVLFTSLTHHYNPLYINEVYAQELGHPSRPINPFLVYATVLGLSVEDLSEGGGPFLGLTDLRFPNPVYSNDTVRAESVVVSKRVSTSRPGWGIVTWFTTGRNQHDAVVVEYHRTNLAHMRVGKDRNANAD
jgi:acyl dehydratase